MKNVIINKKSHIIITITILFLILLYIRTNLFVNPPKQQWYLHKENDVIDISYSEMWELYSKVQIRKPVVVAIIDTGVDLGNKSIEDSLWINEKEIPHNGKDDDGNGYIDDIFGWDFRTNSGDVQNADSLNHSTRIAQIICGNRRKKVWGISDSDYTILMPLAVMGGEASNSIIDKGDISTLLEAIKYAERNGAQICNLSINSDIYYEELYNTIQGSNMLFITSSGNRNGEKQNIDKFPSYPASFQLDNLITVTNIKSNGRVHSSANYGVETVDIAAPGTSIWGQNSDKSFSFESGTSYASPIVTGIAAMIYVCNPDISPEKCKEIICTTAVRNGGLKKYVKGGKIVNLKNALKTSLVGGINNENKDN